ncbi:hypothetical protein [Peribacillus simplex]|uniref:hypothetical protein n=1 Tax=Peribacillus simplex TaxID=1478 RepID=UPI003D2DACA8
MRKILFPIVLAISLLGGCNHGKVTTIGKDNRLDKLETVIAEKHYIGLEKSGISNNM